MAQRLEAESNSKLEDFQRQLDDLRSTSADRDRSRSEMDERLHSALVELDAAKAAQSSASSSMDTLKKQLDERLSSVLRLEDELESRSADLSVARAEMDDVRSQLQVVRDSAAAEALSKASTIDGLEHRSNTLLRQVWFIQVSLYSVTKTIHGLHMISCEFTHEKIACNYKRLTRKKVGR